MGLNLANRQIAQELDLSNFDVQAMTEQLRTGLMAKAPAVVLDGEGARGWLESVLLDEDGRPLERREAVRLPWPEARRHAHAAVLTDMGTQTVVRCLWRGRPDLPKGLKLGAAAAILAEIEHGPAPA